MFSICYYLLAPQALSSYSRLSLNTPLFFHSGCETFCLWVNWRIGFHSHRGWHHIVPKKTEKVWHDLTRNNHHHCKGLWTIGNGEQMLCVISTGFVKDVIKKGAVFRCWVKVLWELNLEESQAKVLAQMCNFTWQKAELIQPTLFKTGGPWTEHNGAYGSAEYEFVFRFRHDCPLTLISETELRKCMHLCMNALVIECVVAAVVVNWSLLLSPGSLRRGGVRRRRRNRRRREPEQEGRRAGGEC